MGLAAGIDLKLQNFLRLAFEPKLGATRFDASNSRVTKEGDSLWTSEHHPREAHGEGAKVGTAGRTDGRAKSNSRPEFYALWNQWTDNLSQPDELIVVRLQV